LHLLSPDLFHCPLFFLFLLFSFTYPPPFLFPLSAHTQKALAEISEGAGGIIFHNICTLSNIAEGLLELMVRQKV
jgi:hypothetical protein